MNKTTSFLTIFSILLFTNSGIIYGARQNNNIKTAIELFDNANFTSAEPLFKTLLDSSPEHIMLNYYYGACRTENGYFSLTDLSYLKKASSGETPVKIDFYMGIQQQAQNNWEQALKHYNKFRLKSTNSERIQLDIAQKIEQCFNQENPYFETSLNDTTGTQIITEINQSANEPTDTFETPANKSFFLKDSKSSNDTVIQSIKNLQEVDKATERNPIEFIVNSKITYFDINNFKTEKGKEFYVKGKNKQNELDRILSELNKLREQYRLTQDKIEKNNIGEKILTIENEPYKLKNEINQMMLLSENAEKNYWQNASSEEIKSFSEKMAGQKKLNDHQLANKSIDSDTSSFINPNLLFINHEAEKSINEKSEKDELIYKIQIGAYRRGLPKYIERLFKKLSYIRKIENYIDDKGIVVYTTGNLTNLEDAKQMQKQVKQEGVEDAQVVPYFKGKRITLEQAKEIEGDL